MTNVMSCTCESEKQLLSDCIQGEWQLSAPVASSLALSCIDSTVEPSLVPRLRLMVWERDYSLITHLYIDLFNDVIDSLRSGFPRQNRSGNLYHAPLWRENIGVGAD